MVGLDMDGQGVKQGWDITRLLFFSTNGRPCLELDVDFYLHLLNG